MTSEVAAPVRCHWSARSSVITIILIAFAATPASAAQTHRGKRLFFGDMHWHSCLSQDASSTTPTNQYESMLYDYGLDFSMASEHAEAAGAGITACDSYLPLRPNPAGTFPLFLPYSGEQIATAMKQAADDWNGRELQTPSQGMIRFVTFPGYEWAPDARCWQASPTNPFPNDYNGDDNTPGHINYFFSDTSGWTYRDDVWAPGDGDSDTCATATALGLTYYDGSKDWVDEILGQLIHQRDDPGRSYDLLIQYNHPAATIDKGGSSDHLAKWFDFEHSSSTCSVAEGGAACRQNQCEAMRRAYGLTTVEWYTNQEASIGSLEQHGDDGFPCTGEPFVDMFSERCYHDTHHLPDRYVTSRGLREGYMLASTGGSDSHSGRWNAPNGFPGSRGAGSRSLTAVYAGDATRPAIWNGLTSRRTYALSRFREIGPVHKGRVDFYSADPPVREIGAGEEAAARGAELPGGILTREYVMGDLVEAVPAGITRSFTISAAAEEGTTGVVPLELRLYRVGPDTALTSRTDSGFYWLDDLPEDPGKFGELIGIHTNATASSALSHTFTGVLVKPGDAIFAVVPYSDYTWIDDYYDMDRNPLDEDGDGVTDPGKVGYSHGDNNTWARTTPIFFHASNERSAAPGSCAYVSLRGSGTAAPEDGPGGVDVGLPGDDEVLPVAIPGGYDREWNRWRFTLSAPKRYVDLSFFTQSDEDDTGHLFAVRIDGRLVYSGRAGIDHEADVLVDLRDIDFPLEAGLHQLEIHMDDQEYATADNDPDFHCNDYDGPPAFLDAISFHDDAGVICGDRTPPVVTCPADAEIECSADGGVPADDPAIQAFLAGAAATDDVDTTPTITEDSPDFFPNGATTVTFTAADDAGNTATCSAVVAVSDSTPPELEAFTLAPAGLRPPNHKLVPISVPTLTAADVCDASPSIVCSVASNEPADYRGDGNQPIDIVFDGQDIEDQASEEQVIETTGGEGSFTLQLRSERMGSGSGRVYTASCLAVDAGGNESDVRSASVVVPK